jgi:ABC-type amino acid transport substrate-binding protein
MRIALATLCLILAAPLAAPLAGAHDAPDTLAKIRATKAITLAYGPDALPFSYADGSGQPGGYSVDLCQRIVAGIERQLGLENIEITWIGAPTPERLALIAEGKADLDCGNTTITLDRQEVVDFSNIIFIESGGVVVKADSRVESLADLAGKKVAVIKGTTTAQRLRSTLEDKLVKATIVEVKDGEAGWRLLEEGQVDAYAGDRVVLVGKAGQSGHPEDFAMLAEDFSLDPYGLALPRGDADFRLAVNRTLAHLYGSSEILQIFRDAFGSKASPSPLLQAVYILNAYQD